MLEVGGGAEQQEGCDPHGHRDMGSVWGGSSVTVLLFHKIKHLKPPFL